MILHSSPSVILAVLLAFASGCEMGVDDGGLSGTGGGRCGDGGACTPDVGEGGGAPGDGRVSGVAEEAESSSSIAGTGGGSVPGDGGGAGLGDGGSGGGTPRCETCCADDPVVGEPRYVVRVDDSNSFASPFVVDALLPAWNGVTPLPVRTHEFLNVYGPRLVAGEGDLVVDAGAVPITAIEGEQLIALQVAVRDVAPPVRPRRTVALVVDTSPSIVASVDRLLGAVDAVVGQLDPADRLGVYSWSPDPVRRELRVMSEVGVLDREELEGAVVRAIEAREPGAAPGTALRTAIEQARAAAAAETTVLLVSDGSTGVDDDTLRLVREAAADEQPVRVVGIGVGPARAYSDEVLDAITDASGGASMYFDGSPAAEALIEERFRELVDVARRDVRLRLSMPDSVELVVTSASDTSLAGEGEVAGQNLAADGTMTFHEIVRWTADPAASPCDAVGWVVEDATGILDAGSIALGDVVGGQALSAAMAEGLAVVATAAALEGPTEARFARAFAAMHQAFEVRGGTWAGSRLGSLCASLSTACARVGDVTCSACPLEPPSP